jgi:hypothetical protein
VSNLLSESDRKIARDFKRGVVKNAHAQLLFISLIFRLVHSSSGAYHIRHFCL